MRSYDMDGILRLISQVSVPAMPAASPAQHHGPNKFMPARKNPAGG